MRRALYTIGAFALALAALAATQYVLGIFLPVESIGLALFGSLFGGGDKTTTTSLDPSAQKYTDWSRGVTQQGVDTIGGMGPMFAGPNWQSQMGNRQIAGSQGFGQNPWMQQYMSGMGQMAGMLPAGMEEFSGAGVDRFMDPYQSRVIDTANADWDRSGQMGQRDAMQGMTLAGGLRNARSGLMLSDARAQNEMGRNREISGIRSQGYNQAADRWGQNRAYMGQMGQAGLGGMFGGAQYGNQWDMQRGQANMQAGEYERALRERMMQEPMYRAQMQAQMANAGVGPYGTTSTEHTAGGGLGGFLGGAMTLGSMIPGIGTGIGMLGSAMGLGGNIMGGNL